MTRAPLTVTIAATSLLLAGCGGGAPAPGGAACGPPRARVERVVDGDTIVIAGGAKVRYLLIDTPESTTTVECYGEEAADANRALVDGRTVDLTYDHPCTDRYGRLLAYVRAGDVDVNAYLVDHGFACVLHIPPAGDDRAADFTTLQSAARAAGLGLWTNCASNPPRCTTR